MTRRTMRPPSPLTGLYLVRNSGGCYLKRGTFRECEDFTNRYAQDRRDRGVFPEACEIVPERLWVECRELSRLCPNASFPVSQYAIEVVQACPTGHRTKSWWGGMEGGFATFEEWEATLGGAVPDLAGTRVRCYRHGTSALDRPPGGHYLTALEIL